MTFENVQDADSLKIYLAQGDTEKKKPKQYPLYQKEGASFSVLGILLKGSKSVTLPLYVQMIESGALSVKVSE